MKTHKNLPIDRDNSITRQRGARTLTAGLVALFTNELANNCNGLIEGSIEDGSRRIV